MKPGRVNIVLDQHCGSSGKGKISTYLADRYGVGDVSSANYPNAGHSFVKGNFKFVAKALPTAGALNRVDGDFYDMTDGMTLYITPGSGFDVAQFQKEWAECGYPRVVIHERASVVTEAHAAREREGADSTKHIASTMQGSGAAISDKVMRRKNVVLARDLDTLTMPGGPEWYETTEWFDNPDRPAIDYPSVQVVSAMEFRNIVHQNLADGHAILHEGSQGYALSIDHGIEYPYTTSRNCGVQAAMDYMAIPPQLVGDVFLNLRTFPIRVGNVVEDGIEVGNSGGWYEDQTETTWAAIAAEAGMPSEAAASLAERERTTVTKRVRRVADFSWVGLRDAVRVNGATKVCVNFVQYLDYRDAGIHGFGRAKLSLSDKSRAFIDKVEDESGLPVVLIGTGADHKEIIDLLD